MNKMLITVSLLTPLMVLHGCQRETPAQAPATAPPASMPSAAPQGPAAPAVAAATQEAGGAAGNDMRALAQKSGCFACHAIDKKLVGPAWNDVADKYRGQKDAERKLTAKVAKGGSGIWGNTAMPPNEPRVTEDDIRTLVRFILSLK